MLISDFSVTNLCLIAFFNLKDCIVKFSVSVFDTGTNFANETSWALEGPQKTTGVFCDLTMPCVQLFKMSSDL